MYEEFVAHLKNVPTIFNEQNFLIIFCLQHVQEESQSEQYQA